MGEFVVTVCVDVAVLPTACCRSGCKGTMLQTRRIHEILEWSRRILSSVVLSRVSGHQKRCGAPARMLQYRLTMITRGSPVLRRRCFSPYPTHTSTALLHMQACWLPNHFDQDEWATEMRPPPSKKKPRKKPQLLKTPKKPRLNYRPNREPLPRASSR